MAEFDSRATQGFPSPEITAELAASGFYEATEIGRGGFGVVYRCRQPSLNRTVAVKVLSADLEVENLERFLREQRAMGALSGHPHIVPIHQVGATVSGRPYIVMQYHRHDSLDALIRRSGPIGWPEAVRLGIKVAGALETAHLQGTIHRDIKPANILLTEYGEPQLTDFGIARISGGFHTATGAVVCSPAFTAPEVLAGAPPTSASDVYSLGATLFCAITGHAAFERRSGEKIVAQFLRISSEPIPDLRDTSIPDDVCTVIEGSMSVTVTDRPSTAAEFGYQLQRIQRRAGRTVDEMALPDARRHADPMPLPTGTALDPSGVGTTGEHAAAPTTSPPTPATRFRPPIAPKLVVARERLIEVLRAGGRRRLTVIHAPTGYGKSTLAAQWRDALSEEAVPVAWLSVDQDDNNVVCFLAHLIEAIRRVLPSLGSELVATIEDLGTDAARYVLTTLINEIHDGKQLVVIILDDWHRIAATEALAAMEFLLDYGCHHLQIVVTSRTRSGLPMSRMRVLDELIEIDSTALRFDAVEAHSFLVDQGGLGLDTEDVAELTDSTDGWVAALQLASLSLRGAEDPSELIEHLSGRHHAIGEFLAENVLDALEPSMLDFLLSTSVTERITGSLATALAGVSRGQAMLEEAEDRDLFLYRIDDDQVWFRYHHLFADFLRHRLARDYPQRIAHLHRVASKWFAEHALLSEAVDHALAAGDRQRAAQLVEVDAMHLIEHSQMATVAALIAKLPSPLVQERPRLLLALAWADILLQRSGPGQQALDLVDSLLDRSSLSTAEVADLRVETDVVRAVARLRSDHIDHVDELLSEALERPDTLSPWVVSTAANLATFLALYQFDFEAAHRRQGWAVTYQRQLTGAYSVTYGYCLSGIAYNEQLDVTSAETTFREAMRIATDTGGAHSFAARMAYALLGELLYERDEITEAERLIEEAYKLGPEGGAVELKIARYVNAARVAAVRGDRVEAQHRLDKGVLAAESLALPRLRAAIINEQVRLGFGPRPEHPPVEYISRPQPTDGLAEITAQLEEESAIRLLLQSSPADRALACDWAQEWVDRISGRGRHRALLRARRLLVAALASAGRTAEAKPLLASIAAQCADLGLPRFLVDGGPQVLAVVEAVAEDKRRGRWSAGRPQVPDSFLTQLLALRGPAQSHPASTEG